MLELLVIENVNTGTALELLPLFIAGGVLIAAAIFGVVLSVISKKNKEKKKAQKKEAKLAEAKAQQEEEND